MLAILTSQSVMREKKNKDASRLGCHGFKSRRALKIDKDKDIRIDRWPF